MKISENNRKKWTLRIPIIIIIVCFLGLPTQFHREFIVSDLDGNVCGTLIINSIRWRFLLLEDRFKGMVVFSSYDTVNLSDQYRIADSAHLKKEAGIKDDFYMMDLFGNYDENAAHSKYATIFIHESGDLGVLIRMGNQWSLAFEKGKTADDVKDCFSQNNMFFS